MRIVFAGVLALAAVSIDAYAGTSASIVTVVKSNVNVNSTQVDACCNVGSSTTSSGSGAYALAPTGEGDGGGGGAGAGEALTLGWTGSVSAPPQSSAQADIAWIPDDTLGYTRPLVHVSNDTEFDSPAEVQLSYDFQTSGATIGDAGAAAINLVTFSVFCTSCTGLPMNYYDGAENVDAGTYYGEPTGAFADEVKNSWDLDLDLMPESTLTVLETMSSGVSLYAQSAVPEPASWTMMMSGLGGLGALVRSRRRKATTTVRPNTVMRHSRA